MQTPINLHQAAAALPELWSPQIICPVNDHLLKVARVEGEFVWHAHEGEDELFIVLDGQLSIEMRDRTVHIKPGECYLVPRGVEHRPVSPGGCRLALLEPATTLHTGGVVSDRTRSVAEQWGDARRET